MRSGPKASKEINGCHGRYGSFLPFGWPVIADHSEKWPLGRGR